MLKGVMTAWCYITIVSGIVAYSTSTLGQTPAIDIEAQRAERLGTLREGGVPEPERIKRLAAELFSLSVQDQPEEKLTLLAREANAYANLLSLIRSQYNEDRRENYRYDFVTKVLDDVSDQYTRLENEYKSIKNRSYFNLGIKSETKGDVLKALLFYNDAFRLSTFQCASKSSVPSQCQRLEAEIAMQRLLNMQGIRPYVHW